MFQSEWVGDGGLVWVVGCDGKRHDHWLQEAGWVGRQEDHCSDSPGKREERPEVEQCW